MTCWTCDMMKLLKLTANVLSVLHHLLAICKMNVPFFPVPVITQSRPPATAQYNFLLIIHLSKKLFCPRKIQQYSKRKIRHDSCYCCLCSLATLMSFEQLAKQWSNLSNNLENLPKFSNSEVTLILRHVHNVFFSFELWWKNIFWNLLYEFDRIGFFSETIRQKCLLSAWFSIHIFGFMHSLKFPQS